MASLRGMSNAERIPLKQDGRFGDEKRNSQQSLTYTSVLDTDNKNYNYDSGIGTIGTVNNSMLDEPNQTKMNDFVN